MKWLLDLSHRDLTRELENLGIKGYTADQIFQWIYLKNNQDIDQWTNVSKVNRALLEDHFYADLNTHLTSEEDNEGTRKVLIELEDKSQIEAVFMKEKSHFTFCISTQVGCPLGCKFCATGKMGFIRNLTPGEILSQVLHLRKDIADYSGKLNLVFMGMGEPLMNYPALAAALRIITNEKGMGISPRNITVSTAGILDKIKQFEAEFPTAKLSFSLNGTTMEKRSKIMPITRKEPFPPIMDYFRSTRRKHRITFEYILIKGLNSSLEDAKTLTHMLRGIGAKVNLIPLNPVAGFPYQSPSTKEVEAFKDALQDAGLTAIVRWSKGQNIKSACGQLATKQKKKTND